MRIAKVCRVAGLVVCSAAYGAEDVSGAWTGSQFHMILKEEGGTVTGTGGPNQREQAPVTDGRVEGDRLTFHLGPYTFDLRMVSGDEMKGEMKGRGGGMNVYVKRAGQQAAPAAFELATMKRVDPSKRGDRVQKTVTPGRFTCSNASLRQLIMGAYDVKDHQIAGPDWMASETYDIVAKIPATTSEDEALRMLKPLLIERLKLKVHREMRELPVYGLVVAKSGLKAKEVEWVFSGVATSPGHMAARSTRMESVATLLSYQVDRPVLNLTGLAGYFEIKLDWTPDRAMKREREPAEVGASVFTAIQEQLGLRLEPRKAPVEMLVVDHVEKMPDEN